MWTQTTSQVIDYKRLLCLKELFSLTVMCLFRDTLRCSLANKPNTKLWVFKPACASFTPSQLSFTAFFPVGKVRNVCGRRRSKIDSFHSTCKVAMAYKKLCLLWRGGWIGFFRGSFLSASPSCITANTIKDIFWKLPSYFAFKVLQTLLPSTHKATELNLGVYANISALIFVALINSL